jgi:hypothetical protein
MDAAGFLGFEPFAPHKVRERAVACQGSVSSLSKPGR